MESSGLLFVFVCYFIILFQVHVSHSLRDSKQMAVSHMEIGCHQQYEKTGFWRCIDKNLTMDYSE